uniref:General transcription and DNA repair factor IIH subunit TFB5 n=1 Tax=Sus scrofa TaxID=9823 RepID=A0A8D2CCE6_PIG
MVNVLKGVLIECDPAMKQFLLYLDESNALGKKFIIQDIDDTHVFVIAELVNVLQERGEKNISWDLPTCPFLDQPLSQKNGIIMNGLDW